MATMSFELRRSYQACARVARCSASNFYWSFWLLPPAQRRAMYALYAFSRQTDDLGDSDEPASVRGAQLARWREQLVAALVHAEPAAKEHAATENAATDAGVVADGQRLELDEVAARDLWPAIVHAVETFGIPAECLFDIVDGVMMDLRPPCYPTFDELRIYCQHVASAVGIACIHIWGFSDPRARAAADACGIAFQLTNILRDLREDVERDRIYLPREEFDGFEYSVDELRRGVVDSRWRAFMRFQICRAERFYDEAASLAAYLHGAGRRSYRLMFAAYCELLAEIKRRDGDVFSRPTRLRPQQKLRLAGAAVLGIPRLSSGARV